jgi:hypothetical protein
MKGCNRHDDCDEAEKVWRERWEELNPDKLFPGLSVTFHCHDECCEECFGN